MEDHIDLSSRLLAEEVAPYPPELVGFCADTANSLGNSELEMNLLRPRAFCHLLKDCRVDGHLLGLQVGGALLGTGRLRVDWFLDVVFARHAEPEIYLENWAPPTGHRDRDVEEDEVWLRASLDYLRQRLKARATATRTAMERSE